MRFRLFCILVLAGLLLNPATAKAETFRSAAVVVNGVPGTVRIATPEPTTIDPALVSTEAEVSLANQLFSGLTRIHPVTKEPIPDLASGWTVSPDGTEYTFTLRSGLKWSNGTALTAAAVRYGILRSLNPATGAPLAYVLYPILNAYEYNNGTATANQVGVTVLSPTQIKFTLTGPGSYFPAGLAMPPAWPQPAAAISQWGSTWTEPGHIVTSGAYKLTQWAHDDKMLLDKWPSFYAAASVKIPKVSIRLTDDATAWSMFLGGTLDTTFVPITEAWWVRTDPELGPLMHDAPGGCTRYFGFNPSLEPFDDPLVRKAFMAAVDRQGLIDDVLNGNPIHAGDPRLAQTFTAPGMFGFVDGVAEGVGVPYNPAQAQAWLATAGFPNGAGLPPITFWSFIRSGHPDIADYLKANWAANLNVNVTVEKLDWAEYIAHLEDGTWQIWRLNWCLDINDAHNFLYDAVVPSFPGRFGGWSNSTYLGLLDDAASSTDNLARKGYYRQAEEILVETDPVVAPLYYSQFQVVTRPYLRRPYVLPADVHIRDWSLTFASKTVVSAGAQDGWTLELAEASEKGGSANAAATTFRLGDEAGDKQYRSVLSFNTAVLPPTAVITGVTLKIKSAGQPVGTNPFTTHGALTVDVKKGTFSNNPLLQAGDFQAAASKLAVMTIPNTPAAGWYSKALPASGLGYINRAGVTQFRLRFLKDDNDDGAADYMPFHSGNSLTAAYKPVLIISFFIP